MDPKTTMPTKKSQITLTRTKIIQHFGITFFFIFLCLSMYFGSNFLDELLPATGILALILLVRIMGEQH